jgi:DNA-binding CsgD family transcriptional regulator/tetratricopeptide (TPR) repeat protein
LAAAEAAAAGEGSLVLVSGEPGIGKTRLVEQLARAVMDAGRRVLWAACWDGDGVPAFWPWTRLVPEFAWHRGASAAGAEEARFRLFEDVAALLRRTAADDPLLLVIDDLQWADTASLLLLRFLTGHLRGSRLLVVAMYRDVEVVDPLRELLGGTAGSYEHVALEGLNRSEVAHLVGSLTGVDPPRDRATALHRRTNGNPLFVRELVRLMDDAREGVDLRVPEGLREVIRRRLDRLSEPCRALLLTASVLGQRFRLSLLEATSGLPEERLAAPLEEAAAARLVEEIPGVVPRYRFTHALVVEVLWQSLGAGRRRELSLRAAVAVEELCAGDVAPRLTQLAHHFRLAGEWARAIEYETRAGQRALGMLAYEAAAVHFERALEMQETAGNGDPLARCRLVLATAEARMASSEIVAARDAYRRAAALARAAGAGELLARAALGVGLATTMGIVDHLEIGLLEEALDAVGGADSVLRSRLLARLAMALHDTASLDRRSALSDQAIAMARRAGDPATLATALLDRHVAIVSHEPAERRLAISGEVVRIASSTGDRRLELRARSLRAGSLLELGDMDAVRVELEICQSMTEELRRGDRSWHLPMARAGLAALSGRLEEAERLAEQGRRQGESTQHPGLEVYHGSVILLIRFLQGRLPELEGMLRRSAERYPAAPEWRCTLVMALSDAGRQEEARQQFEVIAAEDFAIVSAHLPRLHTLALLAVACDAVHDARRAAHVHRLLSPHGDYFVQVGQTGTGGLGSVWYFVGLLCCAMGRWDEAVAHLETAIEMNGRIGAVPFVANSRFQLARALRARGGPGARAGAREQLERAEETARALGLRLWRGGAEPDRPGGAPLSAREWEIARLVADGLGNGEIADRLCISKRTVESHVEHIRGKLGLGSRLAIMRWVVQHK